MNLMTGAGRKARLKPAALATERMMALIISGYPALGPP